MRRKGLIDMNGYKEPLTVVVTCSPRELRALADKCEARASQITLGEVCFVDYLCYTTELCVKLNFDQERTKGSPNFKHE